MREDIQTKSDNSAVSVLTFINFEDELEMTTSVLVKFILAFVNITYLYNIVTRNSQ